MSLYLGTEKSLEFLSPIRAPLSIKEKGKADPAKRRKDLYSQWDRLHGPKTNTHSLRFLLKRYAYLTTSSSQGHSRATGRGDRNWRIHFHPSS